MDGDDGQEWGDQFVDRGQRKQNGRLGEAVDRLADELSQGWAGRAVEGEGLVLQRTLRGLQQRFVIDVPAQKSAEARRLEDLRATLYPVYAAPAKLIARDKEFTVAGPTGLVDGIMEAGRKGVEVNRYKGLGEMNPDQLWETTLDPNARALLQVKVNHADSAEETFSTLMGDLVEPRREFIQTNALNVANLDV